MVYPTTGSLNPIRGKKIRREVQDSISTDGRFYSSSIVSKEDRNDILVLIDKNSYTCLCRALFCIKKIYIISIQYPHTIICYVETIASIQMFSMLRNTKFIHSVNLSVNENNILICDKVRAPWLRLTLARSTRTDRRVCVRVALGNNLRCLRRVNIDWLALFRLARIYPRNQVVWE